jgi:hypothetical protein
MSAGDDCTSPVVEARVYVKNGLMATEAMRDSDLGNSLIVTELHRHLSAAMAMLEKAEQPPSVPGRHTIFASKEAAQDVIDLLPLSPNTIYRVARYPDGKCAIEIFRREGWV